MEQRRDFPRIVIGAAGSGAGKTTVTCAILQALRNRGLSSAAFKCGPDYIDPMFHKEILGIPSRNLDLFFFSAETARALFSRNAQGKDISIVEGVMGYYDGMGDTEKASTWDLAECLESPSVLILNCQGMSLSSAAIAKGFLAFRKNRIRGWILNQMKPMSYPFYKTLLERETGLPVLGYLPPMPECSLESRHLGLVTAGEIADLRQKTDLLARQVEKSIDLDALLSIARSAPDMLPSAWEIPPSFPERVRIGIARDRAFQFYYEDALDLLREMGAELVEFSPLRDPLLPEKLGGILLGGGYPELFARELSENQTMRSSVFEAIQKGMPCIAECGGFLYLHESLEGENGGVYPMVGVLPAQAFRTSHLNRFGYAMLTARKENLLCKQGDGFPAHEFHYWDSTACGDGFTARKVSGREWTCGFVSETLYAGYPHFHFCSCPPIASRFLAKAREYQNRQQFSGCDGV